MRPGTWIAPLVLTVGLLSGCTSSGESQSEPMGPPASLPSSQVTPGPEACAKSIEWVISTPSGGTSTHEIGAPMSIHVGDRMVLSAAPGCHMSFSTRCLGQGVLDPIGESTRGFVAIEPGRARVRSQHAMCDGNPDPQCIGGVALLPAMSVRVIPAT